MKAIIYSIKPHEKEVLSLTNKRRHDLTMISNELNHSTVAYAAGKDVVIVSPYDLLNSDLLKDLKLAGVQKIITRSQTTTHIDLNAARDYNFNIANIPDNNQELQNIAETVIRNLNLWEEGKCVGMACCCRKMCVSVMINDQAERRV